MLLNFKIKVNAIWPLTLLMSQDLFLDFFPDNVATAEIIHTYSPFRQILLLEEKYPWPMTNRRMILKHSLIPCPEHQGFLIV